MTSRNQTNVALCLDGNLEIPAMVLLASLKRWARVDRPISVLILMEAHSDRFERWTGRLVAAEFTIQVSVVGERFAHLIERGGISRAMYLRFLIAEIACDIDKILYLDIDTLVLKDPKDLYDTDLTGQALGAVADYALINCDLETRKYPWVQYLGKQFHVSQYFQNVLELTPAGASRYFNTGVMLMNLQYWRLHGLADVSTNFVKKKQDLRFPDQDALNHVIAGNYVSLDPRWNTPAYCGTELRLGVRKRWTKAGREWKRIRQVWREDPWILHYSGSHKPWSPTDTATVYDHHWWEAAASLDMSDEIIAHHLVNLPPGDNGKIHDALFRIYTKDVCQAGNVGALS